MSSPMSTLSPGRPRMTPLQRIRTNAVMPTIIVTSPGRHVSLCPRAMIQERMNGAVHAATRSQSITPNVFQAVTLSPPLTPASLEFGLDELVVNQGSQSDASRTRADRHP